MNKKTSFGRSPKRRFKTNLFSLMGRTNIACPDSIFTITGGASAYHIFCRKRNENRYTLLSPFSHIKFFTFSQLLLDQRKALLSILYMYFFCIKANDFPIFHSNSAEMTSFSEYSSILQRIHSLFLCASPKATATFIIIAHSIRLRNSLQPYS